MKGAKQLVLPPQGTVVPLVRNIRAAVVAPISKVGDVALGDRLVKIV